MLGIMSYFMKILQTLRISIATRREMKKVPIQWKQRYGSVWKNYTAMGALFSNYWKSNLANSERKSAQTVNCGYLTMIAALILGLPSKLVKQQLNNKMLFDIPLISPINSLYDISKLTSVALIRFEIPTHPDHKKVLKTARFPVGIFCARSKTKLHTTTVLNLSSKRFVYAVNADEY